MRCCLISPPPQRCAALYTITIYTIQCAATPLHYALHCASDKKSQRHVQRQVILSLIHPLLFLAASLHGMRRLPPLLFRYIRVSSTRVHYAYSFSTFTTM